MVAIGNIGRPGDPSNAWPNHMRYILHPLLVVASMIGASVRQTQHADKRVMAMKVVYFVLVNALLFVGPAICVYDIIHVRTVCGARARARVGSHNFALIPKTVI